MEHHPRHHDADTWLPGDFGDLLRELEALGLDLTEHPAGPTANAPIDPQRQLVNPDVLPQAPRRPPG